MAKSDSLNFCKETVARMPGCNTILIRMQNTTAVVVTGMHRSGTSALAGQPYATFQLAEVAVPKELFRKILSLIDDLRPRPASA